MAPPQVRRRSTASPAEAASIAVVAQVPMHGRPKPEPREVYAGGGKGKPDADSRRLCGHARAFAAPLGRELGAAGIFVRNEVLVLRQKEEGIHVPLERPVGHVVAALDRRTQLPIECRLAGPERPTQREIRSHPFGGAHPGPFTAIELTSPSPAPPVTSRRRSSPRLAANERDCPTADFLAQSELRSNTAPTGSCRAASAARSHFRGVLPAAMRQIAEQLAQAAGDIIGADGIGRAKQPLCHIPELRLFADVLDLRRKSTPVFTSRADDDEVKRDSQSCAGV